MNTNQNERLTTEAFAAHYLVKADTVRKNYCVNGHAYGITPTKLPNGRLVWPNPANTEKQEVA